MIVFASEEPSCESERDAVETDPKTRRPARQRWSRAMTLVRRIHLYTGLFLLPWVLLYGVTGAMFNHSSLFAAVSIRPAGADVLGDSPLSDFPTPEEFASKVVEALQASASDATVKLAVDHGAEFTSDIQFEVRHSAGRHVAHIDPVSKSLLVVTHSDNAERLEPMLPELRDIQLDPDPFRAARRSASMVLREFCIESSSQPQPVGWTKLNFLAEVNGEPARVTYVLKDGHIDITRYAGDHGMSLRGFLLRLHVSHGQPPHWNGRMFWTLAVDVMAIAMVCWGLTGLLMWWQLKRTRTFGAVVIALSVLTATLMYLGMHDFYATTKL